MEEGVLGVCGVNDLPTTTRRRGVEGACLESASRCLGVRGVTVCIGLRFSSSALKVGLGVPFSIDSTAIDFIGVSNVGVKGVRTSSNLLLGFSESPFSLSSMSVQSRFDRVDLA